MTILSALSSSQEVTQTFNRPTILVWGGETYASMDIPAEVAAAASTIIGFGLAYLVPDKKTTAPTETTTVTKGRSE